MDFIALKRVDAGTTLARDRLEQPVMDYPLLRALADINSGYFRMDTVQELKRQIMSKVKQFPHKAHSLAPLKRTSPSMYAFWSAEVFTNHGGDSHAELREVVERVRTAYSPTRFWAHQLDGVANKGDICFLLAEAGVESYCIAAVMEEACITALKV